MNAGKGEAHGAVRLRPSVAADTSALTAIWLRSWQATMPQIDFAARLPWLDGHLRELAARGYETICAEVDAEVVGFTVISQREQFLDQIAIDPHAWGGPAAGALIDHAKARCGALALDVNQDNPRAVRFYEKHGFRRHSAGANPLSGRPIWRYVWP